MMEETTAIQALDSAMRTFNFNDCNQIRVIEKDGEPWWIAKDICDVLCLENSRKAITGLDEDEKSSVTISYGTSPLSGNPNMTIISEPGLYSLILRSRKPEAKAFKRWITHEVIPAIRKTGGYIASTPDDSDADIIARGYQAAIAAIERKDQTIAALKAQSAEAAPFANLGRAVSEKAGYMLISEAAVIMAQAGCEFTVKETGERRIIGGQYLRIYLEQKDFIVKRGRSDAGRPTVKGLKYQRIQMKASSLACGVVAYSPTLSPSFVKMLVRMFHEKEMVLPKIVRKGRKTKGGYSEDTT